MTYKDELGVLEIDYATPYYEVEIWDDDGCEWHFFSTLSGAKDYFNTHAKCEDDRIAKCYRGDYEIVLEHEEN